MSAEVVPEVAPGIVSLTSQRGSQQEASQGSNKSCYESCDSSGCDCFDSGDCFDICDTAPDAKPR